MSDYNYVDMHGKRYDLDILPRSVMMKQRWYIHALMTLEKI